MARGPREDYAGAWHHVMNRGIARRTAFESARDRDRFLGLLAEQASAGRIEVHAYCVMTTHFHLLVRSVTGNLSEALRRVLNGYVRAFNRGRRRDGALFRGRFRSRLLLSGAHWEAVLWYIDRNPVDAGLVRRSTDWPHGSAHWYKRESGPPWLSRTVVEGLLRRGQAPYDPRDYPSCSGNEDRAWVKEVVERRMRVHCNGQDPLDDLVRAAPAEVQSWMAMKAHLADGSEPGTVLVSAGRILAEVGPPPGGSRRDGGSRESGAIDTMAAGLLRLASGLTLDEVSDSMRRSTTWVRARLREHRDGMLGDGAYARRAAEVLGRALAKEAGQLGNPSVIPFVSPAERPTGWVRRYPWREQQRV